VEPRYTFVHTDHQQYHTDHQTARVLDTVRRWDATAYQAVFDQARDTGRIAEGPAPTFEQAAAPRRDRQAKPEAAD
jgi:hypothetical protein